MQIFSQLKKAGADNQIMYLSKQKEFYPLSVITSINTILEGLKVG